MPTLLANPFLERPSVVWCWDWSLDSSFPMTFPFTFDVPPFRFSTLDTYPGGVLGDVLYEARLLDKPQLTLSSTDVFGGLEQVDSVKFRLAASTVARWRVYIDTSGSGGGFDPTGFDPAGFDTVGGVFTGIVLTPLGAYPDLHAWVTNEHRGKLLIGHLVELDPRTFKAVTIQQNAFIGETVALADDPSSVSVLARALDLASMTETIPATLITTAWAPYAPVASLGRPVPLGIGIGRRIPCLPVKAQTEEPELFQQTFTAVAATDLLTITDHFLDTGAGPFRASSTGTLPGGLLATVEYWAVVFDDHQLRLATTLGKALTGVVVDLTDAGAGIHTLTGGLAPNLSEEYDLVVGHGNIGIVRVWEDEAAQGSVGDEMPDAPVTYAVQHRTYRPGGRYATSLRFQEQLDGVSISADLLRVYPDVDDAVVAEWKWLTSLRDDVGGYDASSSPRATELAGTANLTPTHQRYGLGGVALDGAQWLEIPTSGVAMALQTFTLELEAIPAITNRTGSWSLAAAPRWPDTVNHAWQLYYNDNLERLEILVLFADGSNWSAQTATGSAPRGKPLRVTLRRDGTAGKTDVLLGRTQVLTDTRAAALAYKAGADQPLLLGGGFGFLGTLGWVRYSSIARSARYVDGAYFLWRRNAIEFCRELATDARRLVNGARFDAAAAALDAVEGGTLYADGWLLDENELRAVLDALVPFRDLQFSIGTDTRLAVDVAAPPTVIQGQFGHGDDYANLLELPTRTRASLTEAPRAIAVRFRRTRAAVPGPFGGYAMEITRPVLGVGKDAPPLELPFVDHPVTADQIADLRAKRLRTRDSIIDLVLGHEGRLVTKGGAIRLNVPAMAIVDQDLEAIQLAKGAEKVALRGVPTAAADFIYTPGLLPADPADRTLQVTDLGNTQALQAILANGRLTLQLNLSHAQVLRPNGPGLLVLWSTLVGAPTHWQAVAEAVADDATSYVESGTTNQGEMTTFADLVLTLPAIDSIVLHGRLRATVGTATVSPFFKQPVSGAFAVSFGGWVIPSGVWMDFTFSVLTDPLTGKPWTGVDVNLIHGGVNIETLAGGGTVQLTQLYLTANQRQELPLEAGWVRYWIRGPSLSPPDTPIESDPSQFTAVDLAPQAMDLPNAALGLTGTTGDTFWCWAGVYDEFGRLLALVGPTSVTLP